MSGRELDPGMRDDRQDRCKEKRLALVVVLDLILVLNLDSVSVSN